MQHDQTLACSHPLVDLALKALGRNRLQTGLTHARHDHRRGHGAGDDGGRRRRAAHRSSSRCAPRASTSSPSAPATGGPKQEETGEAVAHQGDARDTLVLPVPDLEPRCPADPGCRLRGRGSSVLPSRRRPDGEARSSARAAAAGRSRGGPRIRGDAELRRMREAISDLPGVQYVAGGVHENARVYFGSKRWFTRMHGTDVELPSIKRGWTLAAGRFFTAARAGSAAQVLVIGQVVADKLFGAGREGRRAAGQALEPAVRGRRRRDQRHLGRAAGARRRPVRRRLHAVHDDPSVVEPVEAERHHRSRRPRRAMSRGWRATSPSSCASGTASASNSRTTSPSSRRRRKALTTGGLPPGVARAVAGNVAELEKVTLEQLATTLERASRTMTWLLAAVAAVSLRGRRHRHHEHHAALGHRADARNRPPPGGGRADARRDAAVPHRGGDDQPGRRRRRHPRRRGRRGGHRAHAAMGDGRVAALGGARLWRRGAGRCLLRLVSGEARVDARPDRTPLRREWQNHGRDSSEHAAPVIASHDRAPRPGPKPPAHRADDARRDHRRRGRHRHGRARQRRACVGGALPAVGRHQHHPGQRRQLHARRRVDEHRQRPRLGDDAHRSRTAMRSAASTASSPSPAACATGPG